ncbi:hypothetical protein FRB98_006932 [Tulasnella sp. 332]|nr:hypothetical protein FRB98_006932 [Tulasnella sp. 332]
MYWRRGNGENPEVIDSHWEDLTGPMRELTPETEAAGRAPSQPPIRHYYSTVTAVKFDPLRPHIFVSASLDKTVLPWFYDDKTGRVEESLEGPISNYEFLPQIIDFKPLSSILAVGCSDGCTYIHSPHINEPSCLDLRSTMQLEVTSQVWGHPNSLYSDYLFTGGGSPFVEEKTFRRGKSIRSSPAGLGWASAWIMRPDKAERACNLFSRKARRLCENLDVDPIGQRISLVSFDMKSAGSQHTLDFLDLRAPSMQSVHHQDLPRFTNGGGQVLSASFSPDGIFWACARDDNTAHVWDSRFMNRDGNPMRILSHGPGLDPKDAYGVTAMTWINHHGSSSRPVLVTGGDDGRILEWDIRTARPRVVATLETSVGYFTIGDVYKNEMPLVALVTFSHLWSV